MPRSGKEKSFEEHLKDGTYKPCRQGIKPTINDYERINEMKETLFNSFYETKAILEKIDIDKNPETYKVMNGVMIEQIKAFFSIAKNKVIKDDEKNPKPKF